MGRRHCDALCDDRRHVVTRVGRRPRAPCGPSFVYLSGRSAAPSELGNFATKCVSSTSTLICLASVACTLAKPPWSSGNAAAAVVSSAVSSCCCWWCLFAHQSSLGRGTSSRSRAPSCHLHTLQQATPRGSLAATTAKTTKDQTTTKGAQNEINCVFGHRQYRCPVPNRLPSACHVCETAAYRADPPQSKHSDGPASPIHFAAAAAVHVVSFL